VCPERDKYGIYHQRTSARPLFAGKRFIEAWKRTRVIVDTGGSHASDTNPPTPPTAPQAPK